MLKETICWLLKHKYGQSIVIYFVGCLLVFLSSYWYVDCPTSWKFVLGILGMVVVVFMIRFSGEITK